ncbi:Bromodomain transcription factor, putative isoform 1 [Hibiscus syriacus]|uniref:Bromodomain transcription factor, putative isoform 1 n=1 Tax=Hibiscus syriacus TaxID=106335 RepID=A0A6A2XS32_HIBSY|nr:Bromodomain transcription factor, putative isoform 1 [Hibiscus syriacus]
MSSKLMYYLSDENPDLHKQIGCMNGLFHFFDCHHFYGSRRIAHPRHKRLPSGQNGKHGTEAKIGSNKIEGNNLKKTWKEKQRFSFESPRTSMSSSSCSSSVSPADFIRESHVDRSFSSRTAFCETPRKETSSFQSNAPLQSSQNSLSVFRTDKAPRFSHDGRGSQDAHKSKPKDIPRLSLDGRESSIKGSIRSMESNCPLGDLNKSSMNNDGIRNQQQETGSYEGTSSVVAKLMGLKVDPLSPSSRVDENKKSPISCCSRKELTSPSMINAEAKELVYGEIDTRLAELEFTKPEKDLGALKQMLEAMQKSRRMSGTQKEEKASSLKSHTNSILGQSLEVPNSRKLHSSNAVSATSKGTSSPTCLKSPIKIIKASKVMENVSNSTSSEVATGNLSKLRTSSHATTRYEKADKRSDKDLTPRPSTPRDPSSQLHSRDKNAARTLRLNQISKGNSPIVRENPKMAVSFDTTCLKLHEKKLEMGKQSLRINSASDHSRTIRQSRSLQAQSGLPHRKPRHISHNMRQSDDQLSDISSDMRDLSHQGDDSSMQSESNISMVSYGDNEVTSAQSYGKIEGTFSPKQEKKQKNPAARLVEGDTKEEPPRTALEQPSPVSVLDATFYGDESPSPVKIKSKAFEGLLNELDFSFMAYQLHPSGHLINPNLFPFLEQIKESIWFLNRKHSGRKVNQLDPIEKSRRQLIFDAVNEILIIKSVQKGSYKQWFFPSMQEDRRRKTQQLVRDLCSEIDELQTTLNIEDINLNSILKGDLPIGSMDWTDCRSEIPWLVLDVERLIFKDLICEVISSEVENLQQQQRRSHCRRLFLK